MLAIPRTLRPQLAHHSFEGLRSTPQGLAQPGYPEGSQMVGRNAIKVIPDDLLDVFVGQTKAGDHRDGGGQVIVEGQLDR